MKEIRSAPDVARLRALERADGFVVEIGEAAEPSKPSSIKHQFLRALRDPGWLTSVAVHLALVLLLAVWMIPSLKQAAMLIVGEFPSESAEQFETLRIGKIEFEAPLESEVQDLVDQQDDLEFEEDLVLESDPQPLAPFNGLDGALVEHNLELTEINELLLATASLDAETTKAIGVIQDQVEKAGGKSGEVQFSLVWKTISDLDLHVVTPEGERIYFENRQSKCTGVLDVDRNANEKETTRKPVENIRWLKNKPREGRYTVIVHLFQPRGTFEIIDYELMAKIGDVIELKHDKISEGKRLKVARYIFIPLSVLASERENRLAWYRELQADEEAKASKMFDKIDLDSVQADQRLWEIVRQYPHTEAAIKALSLIAGSSSK